MVWSQPGQVVHKTLSWKHPSWKKGWCSGSRCRPWVQAPVLQKKRWSQETTALSWTHIISKYMEHWERNL
jgi:hypothetical protein